MRRLNNWMLVSLLLGGFTAVTLTSCSEEDNPIGPEATALCLTVNGEHYDISLPATEAVNLKTLCTEFDADIQIGNAEEFQTMTVNGQSLNDGKCVLSVPEIAQDTSEWFRPVLRLLR